MRDAPSTRRRGRAETFDALCARLAPDLTTDDLATRSGVSLRTIIGYRQGLIMSPNRSTVAALARALGCGETECLRAIKRSRQARNTA